MTFSSGAYYGRSLGPHLRRRRKRIRQQRDANRPSRTTDIDYPTKTALMAGFDAEDDATLTQDRS